MVKRVCIEAGDRTRTFNKCEADILTSYTKTLCLVFTLLGHGGRPAVTVGTRLRDLSTYE